MCSTVFTVVVFILGATTTAHATNCCQECEVIDATCYSGCEDRCETDQDCLGACYDSCDEWSAACWGIQGQGSYCIYCTGPYTPSSYLCLYSDCPTRTDWWCLDELGCWAIGD